MKRESGTGILKEDRAHANEEKARRGDIHKGEEISLSSHERLDRALSLLTSRPKLAKQHSSKSTVSLAESGHDSFSAMSSASDLEGLDLNKYQEENENEHPSINCHSSEVSSQLKLSNNSKKTRSRFFRTGSDRSINSSSKSLYKQPQESLQSQDNPSLAFLTAHELALLPKGTHEYYLKKRCNSQHLHGIRWVEDPTGETWLHHTRHWPRDWASIRGKPIKVNGRRWLLATQVRQTDDTKWHTAPKGAAIPFHAGDVYCLVEKKLAGTSRDRAMMRLSKSLSSRSCGVDEASSL